ncbi:MAG: hypothetical protein JST42_21855 [Bacteroidetes bacterium]|nr:hypothetical protein [Bacteroidota bacterium]
MKKKVLLSALAVVALALTFTVAKADDETGGGPLGFDCLAPLTNICYNVVQGGQVIASVKGVLTQRK